MKIKDGFILKKVMGSYMIVCTDESCNFNGMQTLNETGAFLWNSLCEETTKDSLVEKMLAEYDADEATVRQDVSAFLESLASCGLLEE